MKIISTTLVTIFLSLPLQAQTNVDKNSVYLRALQAHLDYLDTIHKKKPELFQIPEIYFIECDNEVTTDFPSKISGHRIKLMTRKEILKKVKGHNKFLLLAIRSAFSQQGKMEIHVVEYLISGNKNNLDYVNQMNGSAFLVKNGQSSKIFELERIE